MGKEDKPVNALVNFLSDNIVAESPIKYELERHFGYAWEIIGGRKEVLDLHSNLMIVRDKTGLPIKILPIPPYVKIDIEINEEENIALAILETYLFIKDYSRKDDDKIFKNNLPIANLICLSVNFGILISRLRSIKKGEEKLKEFFAAGYFAALDENNDKVITHESNKIITQEAKKYIKERSNFMREEIKYVIQEIEKSGYQPTTAKVWSELIKRCGQNGSCCLNTETSDKGEEIAWKGACGQVSRLSYGALQKRLERESRR